MNKFVDVRYVRILVSSVAMYLLLFWFAGATTLFLLPVLTALLTYVLCRESIFKTVKGIPEQTRFVFILMALGALAGLIGSLAAVAFLSPDDFLAYFDKAGPVYNKDVRDSVYEHLYPLILANNPATQLGAPFFVLLTTITTAGISFALGLVKSAYKAYVSWAIVVLACALFAIGVFQATPEFRQKIAGEPPDGSYGYDAVVYLKTFYLMADKGYYPSFVDGWAGDTRAGSDGTVRGGKFYKSFVNPFYFRTPTVFYLWRWLTFGQAVGILYLSVICGLGLIVLGYLAGKRLVGESGVFLSMAIVPYLIFGSIWHNLFFPDWWAGLAMTAGILFWMLERYWPAAGCFLLASAFREVVFVMLIFFFLMSLVAKKEARLPLGLAAGSFLLVYPWHYIAAKPYFAVNQGVAQRIGIENFASNSAYMMFPYGYFLWPPAILLVIALLVWIFKRKYDMAALTIAAGAYLATGSSSYWGQHLLPFIIFSAFMAFLLKMEDIRLPDFKKS